MADHSELKKLAEAAPEGPWFGPEYAPGTSHVFDVDLGTLLAYESIDSEKDACLRYVAAANPAAVLALIAENESLKGPHDWLAEDLIKELVDNAQALQENSDLGESGPFAIVLLAAASRIRRQEGSIDKLKAENEQLAKTASCWDRLNIQNKALSDSFRAERDQLKAENERLKTLRSTTERDLAQELEVWRHGPSCWNCGDTGDVHDMVGEWRGQCDCNAAKLIEVASERDQLKADNEALRKDAERYRWLRIDDWWRSPMCVIRNPKDQAKLGSDCPSSDRLDAAIDAAIGKVEQS